MSLASQGPDEQKGQEVLIQRMRAGKHTSEEILAVLQQRFAVPTSLILRNLEMLNAFHSPPESIIPFRATIEEDYAKKLLKLSKLVMGREETG